jgi:Fe-S-cluster containining protein
VNGDPVNSTPFPTASLDLSVAGKRLKIEVSVPEAPVRAHQLLPLFRSLADSFVGLAVDSAEAAGAKISCRKGCGACCRQLVPISETEARQLTEMVAGMPEPRRSEILSRFQSARRRLEETGLLNRLLEP